MRWVLVFGIAARMGEGGCADDDFCIARVLLVYSLRAKHLSTREDVASWVYCGMVWLSLSLSSRATLTMSTQPCRAAVTHHCTRTSNALFGCRAACMLHDNGNLRRHA